MNGQHKCDQTVKKKCTLYNILKVKMMEIEKKNCVVC